MFVHKILMDLHIFAFWITTILVVESYGIIVNYTENTELIQQRAGNDMKLQCGLKGLVDETKLADIKIHWYFKQCNPDTTVNCHDFHEDDWTQLPCEENFCKPDLVLRNVTEKYSGLYKCTVYPHRSDKENSLDIQLDPGIKLVRTYQLDVKNTDTSIGVPEFLDSYPLNKTAAVDAQVVFQCRVHSEEVHPTIKWFRRIPELSSPMEYAHAPPAIGNFSAHIVKYGGRTYELLATAREKFISDDIYLSKLILNGVRLEDEGYYACVAISYRGHRIRETYLQVYANDEVEYWADYDDSDEGRTDPSEFWLLFLMPLSLAMLPISVWLCYVIYKRCKVDAEAKSVDRQYSDEEMAAAEHCMIRN